MRDNIINQAADSYYVLFFIIKIIYISLIHRLMIFIFHNVFVACLMLSCSSEIISVFFNINTILNSPMEEILLGSDH